MLERNVESDAQIISDNPCVVTRSNIKSIARTKFHFASIRTHDGHHAGLYISNVVLRFFTGLGARVLGPIPTGLEMSETDSY
jgi:hypothetical protein